MEVGDKESSGAAHENGKTIWESGEASQLARYPPDLKIPVRELNDLIVCGICNCYIYNTTTIIECMHSFCRKCIYYHIEISKTCPTCDALLDPSNPIASLREDKIMQEIIFKLVPSMRQEEKQRMENFYKERKMEVPENGFSVKKKISKQVKYKVKHWISIKLEFIGPHQASDKNMPTIDELKKCFIRLPLQTSVKHIQKYLAVKLQLSDYFQALLFHRGYLLHDNLTLQQFMLLFYPCVLYSEHSIILIEYGIAPKGRDYFYSLETDATRMHELTNRNSNYNSDADMEGDDDQEDGSPTVAHNNSNRLKRQQDDSSLTVAHNNSKRHQDDSNLVVAHNNGNRLKRQLSNSSSSVGKEDGNCAETISKVTPPRKRRKVEKKTEQEAGGADKDSGSAKKRRPYVFMGDRAKICSLCHRVQVNLSGHFNVTHRTMEVGKRKLAMNNSVKVSLTFVEGDSLEGSGDGECRYCCVCNMLQSDVTSHLIRKHRHSVAKRGLSALLRKSPVVTWNDDRISGNLSDFIPADS